MKDKSRLIALMNSYSQGKSGADVLFVEVAKRIKNYDKIVVTSLLGKKLCQSLGLKGKYLITTKEKEFGRVILTYLKRIIKALLIKPKVRKGDVILSTSDFLPDVLPAFFLKVQNKKAKWVQKIFHLIPFKRPIPFFAQRISFFLIKRFADLVVTDNQLLREKLAVLGFDKKKIFVNYPGVDFKFAKSVKTRKNFGYEGVFMGQLRVSKGTFELVKIWKLVCQKTPQAKLGIIGTGGKKVIRKLKLEIQKERLKKNIKLLGFLPDKSAWQAIKSSSVFVSCSSEEGFGMAALEAQSLGLPVVAWDLPVFAEVFPRGMVKVKLKNRKKFASEIVKLLKNKDYYKKLSREAFSNAQKYSLDKTAERELELIKRSG